MSTGSSTCRRRTREWEEQEERREGRGRRPRTSERRGREPLCFALLCSALPPQRAVLFSFFNSRFFFPFVLSQTRHAPSQTLALLVCILCAQCHFVVCACVVYFLQKCESFFWLASVFLFSEQNKVERQRRTRFRNTSSIFLSGSSDLPYYCPSWRASSANRTHLQGKNLFMHLDPRGRLLRRGGGRGGRGARDEKGAF